MVTLTGGVLRQECSLPIFFLLVVADFPTTSNLFHNISQHRSLDVFPPDVFFYCKQCQLSLTVSGTEWTDVRKTDDTNTTPKNLKTDNTTKESTLPAVTARADESLIPNNGVPYAASSAPPPAPAPFCTCLSSSSEPELCTKWWYTEPASFRRAAGVSKSFTCENSRHSTVGAAQSGSLGGMQQKSPPRRIRTLNTVG
eukprot:1799919-Pyramimonas_sp.AAC.2